MTLSLFSAGAIWRKWDLHVHSPAPEGFKGEYENFVIQLGNSTCDAIGLTALPVNPDTARGFSDNMLLDEFAFHSDSRAIWEEMFPFISKGEQNCAQ